MTEWFFYGLIYSLILALLLASLLLVKRLFSKQLSPRGQYRLWLVLPAVCTAPFLPFSAGDLLPQRTGLASAAGSISIDSSVAPSSGMETVRDLAVDGNDVMACGVPAGPPVGKALARLTEEVIEGRLPNERETLLEFLRGNAGTSEKP